MFVVLIIYMISFVLSSFCLTCHSNMTKLRVENESCKDKVEEGEEKRKEEEEEEEKEEEEEE